MKGKGEGEERDRRARVREIYWRGRAKEIGDGRDKENKIVAGMR